MKLRFLSAICLPLLMGVCPAHAADSPIPVVRYDLPTMGTVGTVALATMDSAARAEDAEAALQAFAHVDSLMSNWKGSSELSRINREAYPNGTEASQEVLRVIELGQRVHLESRGSFDMTVEPLVRVWGFLGGSPRVPSQEAIARALVLCDASAVHLDASRVRFDRPGLRLDLGGIAKGYAADRAAGRLRARGVQSALVDLSGNMVPIGRPPGRSSWRVGLRDPESEFDSFATLALESDCVATSGNYEQFVAQDGQLFGHILDPRSGWPAEGLDAVTVLAPTAAEADAWATAFMVLGLEDSRRIALQREDLAVVLVQSASQGKRRVWAEEGLRSRLSPTASSTRRFEFWWFGLENDEER